MKKLLLILTFMLSILLFIGCQNVNDYSNGGSQALSALRTPYVGDAPAVSRIIQVLPLPHEDWLQRFFEMETSIAPYSLTVFYELASLSTMQSQDKPAEAFEVNALLLFALIDNLSEITFAVRYTPDLGYSSDYNYSWTISRNEIAELFGVSSWGDLFVNIAYFEDLLEVILARS